MNRQEIEARVAAAYATTYGWKVQVTEVVMDVFGGHIAVTRATTAEGYPNEEMCFVSGLGDVRIFRATEELVRFLEDRSRASWYEKLTYRPVFTALVFLLLILLLFVAGFMPPGVFNPNVLPMLGAALAAACGYFFGLGRSR